MLPGYVRFCASVDADRLPAQWSGGDLSFSPRSLCAPLNSASEKNTSGDVALMGDVSGPMIGILLILCVTAVAYTLSAIQISHHLSRRIRVPVRDVGVTRRCDPPDAAE